MIYLEVEPDRPDPAVIEEAGRFLRAGGVLAHPSDTVYGFAAAARHEEAVARMRTIKGLASNRPVIVLIDEPSRLDGLAYSIRRYAVDYMATFWPGPLTLIFNALPDAPCRGPEGSIALRCPAQPLTRGLIAECAGLLASTSANPAREALLRTGREIAARFGESLAMVLADFREERLLQGEPPMPGGRGFSIDIAESNVMTDRPAKDRSSPPDPSFGPIGPAPVRASRMASTIVDCRSDRPLLVREGVIPAVELNLNV